MVGLLPGLAGKTFIVQVGERLERVPVLRWNDALRFRVSATSVFTQCGT